MLRPVGGVVKGDVGAGGGRGGFFRRLRVESVEGGVGRAGFVVVLGVTAAGAAARGGRRTVWEEAVVLGVRVGDEELSGETAPDLFR